ncbi:MAG: alpha/beta fold hydrolase [Chloroflexota bacterium]
MKTFLSWAKKLLPWILAAGLILFGYAGFKILRSAFPIEPTAFYTPPNPLPDGAPGTIIRSEPITDNVPDGAQAWRVMYLSTGVHGEPVAVTSIIAAPVEPSAEPRPVIAWAHGTLGVLPACGTSHLDDPFAAIPEVPRLLQEGYVLAATDYPGIGAPGVHPYLFGEVEADSVLDSVRAAQQLDINAGNRFAVWGHSQGGHATLWTAMEAADYAPELNLVGAAAIAPATDLEGILETGKDSMAGAVLFPLVIKSWSAYAPDINLTDLITPDAVDQVEALGDLCVTTPAALLFHKLNPPADYLISDPTQNETIRALIAANTPDGPIDVPLLIVHGTADSVIPYEGGVRKPNGAALPVKMSNWTSTPATTTLRYWKVPMPMS